MQVDQAQPLAHGHSGTPVGDLFLLGNSVLEMALGALSAQSEATPHFSISGRRPKSLSLAASLAGGQRRNASEW